MSRSKSDRLKLPNPCKVGDIFCYRGWGSGVDFYQVLAVRGGDVIIRQIVYESVEKLSDHLGADEYVMPRRDVFVEPEYEGDERGAPLRKRVQFHKGSEWYKDGEPFLGMGNYTLCCPWDGEKKYVSHDYP